MFAQLRRSLYIFWTAIRLLLDYLWNDFADRFRSEAARKAAEERAYSRWGRLLTHAALHLHGLIIKVGQFLSTRVDVLPTSFTKELAGLQDAVPPAPFAAIRRRVEEELGASLESIFAEFEPEALASASLGQVHRARLKEGPVVAVKVLRPGVERLVATDLAALSRIIHWLERHTTWGRRFDLSAILEEFRTITHEEMDYQQEAESIRRFRRNFSGVPGIGVPFPYDNLVTRRVIVIEFKAGMKVTERDRLLAAGLDPQQLAVRLIDSYMKQVLEDGFVHVDPHPGNLLIEPNGTVVFIDFGMMLNVTPDDRKHFTNLITTLATRNFDEAIKALEALGFLRKWANHSVLKRALGYMLDMVSGVRLQPGPEFDRFFAEFRDWLYEEPLQFPARFLYVGRAAGLLAGLCSGLDPGIDWMKVLREQALPKLTAQSARAGGGFDWRSTLNDLFGPAASVTVDTIWKQISTTGLSLVRLPLQLEHVLGELETGTLQVQTDLSAVTERLEQQTKVTGRLSWAILAGAAGVVGALLRTGGAMREAQIAWTAAAVALFGFTLTLLSGGRRRRRPSPSRRSPRT